MGMHDGAEGAVHLTPLLLLNPSVSPGCQWCGGSVACAGVDGRAGGSTSRVCCALVAAAQHVVRRQAERQGDSGGLVGR